MQRNDVGTALKIAVQQDLANAKYSVDELAQAMTALAGREVTSQMLEQISAKGNQHMIPVYLVPAWVRVTGSRRILDVLQERI